jgi:hypothetical protein
VNRVPAESPQWVAESANSEIMKYTTLHISC